MKTYITAIILLSICFTTTQAQDKIIKDDGSEIKAKILEIDGNAVKYQEEGDTSGPIRHLNSANIFMVIYANGKREYFDRKQTVANNGQDASMPTVDQVAAPSLTPIDLPDYELISNITPPPTGHAAIYFFRPSVVGYAVPFDVYKDDRMITALKVKNYERYTCPAGTHHFIGANMAEDIFLTAHLRAGGIYFVRLNGLNGDMEPIDTGHKEFQDLLKLITKKEPFISDDERLQKQTEKYSRLIEEKKNRLNGLVQHGMIRSIPVLQADMAIPYEILRKQ